MTLLRELLHETNFGEETIRLGGEDHPMKRVPMKFYDEYKKKFPGARVKFRGPKKGKMNTSKEDATHFYIVDHKGGDRKYMGGTTKLPRRRG